MPGTIDVHCHHLALTPKHGGFASEKFASGYRFRFYLAMLGILNWQDALLRRLPERERLDDLYRERLLTLAESSSIDHYVALAFDGVYDERGRFDRERTPKYVSNEAVVGLTRSSKKFLLGASVNPMRRDWSEELDRVIEAGAVLIKWLPNVMGFDPKDPRFVPFYEKLRAARLPILMHVGFEYAVDVINARYADLDRLEGPLEAGVTVIAAHCCGGRPIVDSGRMFLEMRSMLEKYPNLFIDVSAMASFHRKSRFVKVLGDSFVLSRAVYGSDYPIPLHPWAFRKELGRRKVPDNYFAKDLAIKEACGLPRDVLARGYELLGARMSRCAHGVPHCGSCEY